MNRLLPSWFGRPFARQASGRRHRRVSLEHLEVRSLLAGDIWTQRGGDAGHTGYVDVSFDPSQLEEAWSQPLNYPQSGTGSWQERAVAIDESHVYRVDLEGYAPSGVYHVFAYDVATGAESWHRMLQGNAFEGVGEPSVAGGIVYVNRAGHSGISGGTDFDLPRLYGFDAATGNTLLERRYAAQWGSNERPVIADNQLVVEDGYYGGISSYTASTLSRQWFVGRSAAYDPPLAAIDDEYVYAFHQEVYRRTDGARLPNIAPPAGYSSVGGPMVSSSGLVLFTVGGSTSGLSAYDGDTHQPVWTTPTSSFVTAKAVGNGLVAVAAGRQVIVLNEADGSQRFVWNAPSGLTDEIVLTRTHVLVQSANFGNVRIHAIDLATGQEVWSYDAPTSSSGSSEVEMAFGSGHLLLSHRNYVRALAPAANSAPVAADDAATTGEETAIAIAVLGNDTDSDGDTLTVQSATQPANGSVTINADGTITYTPALNFAGDDSFDYTISDGNGGSATATVVVTVGAVNDEPVAADDSVSLSEDTAETFAVLANDTDADGDALAVAEVTQPTSGSVTLNADNTLTYAPNANFAGSDSFTYTVSDGNGGTSTATVHLTIDAVNDAPTATDSVFTLEENAAVGTELGFVIAADVDGDPLSFALSGEGADGFAIDPQTGRITVADAALLDYETTPQFDLVVEASDSAGGTATANVRIDLVDVPENESPEISIDVRPADPANRTNLQSKQIEVAILGSATFNPVTSIDLSTVRLRGESSTGGASVMFHHRHGYRYWVRDVNGDGIDDMVLKFETSDTGLSSSDDAVVLEGQLTSSLGGEFFSVSQAVSFLGGKGKKSRN